MSDLVKTLRSVEQSSEGCDDMQIRVSYPSSKTIFVKGKIQKGKNKQKTMYKKITNLKMLLIYEITKLLLKNNYNVTNSNYLVLSCKSIH